MKQLHVLALLLILHISWAKNYRGAEIRTSESFLYGRFEVKMKSCEASGMLMSFFTFYDNPDFATNWNEIDIEILGRYSNEVQFNAIVGKHEMHEKRQVLDFNPHKDFHVYSFDWTPEYIAWSVDGKEVFRQTGEHIAKMNKKQKIMMNIWPSQFWDWTGPWKEDVLPLTAMYDYVKYYSYNPSNNSFKLSWEDNFDSLDYGRWSFANHTFDGNACDFIPDNGKVNDGFLSLILNKEGDEIKSANTDKTISPFSEVELKNAEYIGNNKIKVNFTCKVNKVNAKKENFSINGLTITGLKFNLDMDAVELTVSEYNKETEYEIIFTPPPKSIAVGVRKIKVSKPEDK